MNAARDATSLPLLFVLCLLGCGSNEKIFRVTNPTMEWAILCSSNLGCTGEDEDVLVVEMTGSDGLALLR